MKNQIRLAITSIGSGVGQSIINSCKLSELSIYTLGLGYTPFAYGAYDCDARDYILSIYSENYVSKLIEKCKDYKIECLIPGLDDELLKISENIEEFKKIGVEPIVASPFVVNLCRNKLEMYKTMSKEFDCFAKTFDSLSAIEEIGKGNIRLPLMAKPKSGFASQGIKIINKIDDIPIVGENYILQEILIPFTYDKNRFDYVKNLKDRRLTQVSEVSSQFVVGKDGNVLGNFTTINKLKNGVPIEIIPYENKEIQIILEKVITYLINNGLKGPLNIQGRMTDNGFKIFEMNSRFTGITGLRALMGFNEVEKSIINFLGMESRKGSMIGSRNRIGIRQVSDRIISYGIDQKLDKEVSNTKNAFLNNMGKRVLITGSTGFLGSYTVDELEKLDFIDEIVCLVRNKTKAKQLFKGRKKVRIVNRSDVENGWFSFGGTDVLIHCAFSRIPCGYEAIAKSLNYSFWVLNLAYKYQIPAVINISSQSVYGLTREPLWNEEMKPIPENPYAEAKLAVEYYINTISEDSSVTEGTSLRLARLIGPKMNENEMLCKFVKQSLKGEDIVIIGGSQTLDLIDVRDVSKAIIELLKLNTAKWKNIYNIGSGRSINIKEIANTVVNASNKNKHHKSKIKLKSGDVNLKMGLDIKRMICDTGWKPAISLRESITDIIRNQISKGTK